MAPGPDGVRVRNGKRLSLLMVYGNGSQLVRTISAQVQQMYRPLGVEIELKGFDYATLYAAAQNGGILNGGKFDLRDVLVDLGFRSRRFVAVDLRSGSPAGNNSRATVRVRWKPRNGLALSTFDRPVRKRAYATIQSLLLREAAGRVHLLPIAALRARRRSTNFMPNGTTESWNAQDWSSLTPAHRGRRTS